MDNNHINPLQQDAGPRKIAVHITASEISHIREDGFELFLLDRLKAAGIPVKGALKFGNVESGSMIRIDTPSKIAFVWSSDPHGFDQYI